MCSSTIVETAARSSATLAATTPRPCRIHRNLYACATSVTCSWSVVTRVHASANRFCPSYARRGRFTQGREQTMGKQWKKGSIPHIYSLSLSLWHTYTHVNTCFCCPRRSLPSSTPFIFNSAHAVVVRKGVESTSPRVQSLSSQHHRATFCKRFGKYCYERERPAAILSRGFPMEKVFAFYILTR